MAGIPLTGNFTASAPVLGNSLQGGAAGTTASPQSGGVATIQGSSPALQPGAVNPQNLVDPTANAGLTPTTVDPAAQAAAQQAAQAASLRDQISSLISSVKDIYNGRYGQVDASAGEQAGKLNDRFGKESASLAGQIGDQNQQAGAAYAGNGTYDSSYRGNAQDTITKAGNDQISSLGNDLQDNLAAIAQWVTQQKAGFDSGKNSLDTVASRLASETDPNNLITLRNQLDNQIATLQGQGADANTQSQNMTALEKIAPSAGRATQLHTTLQAILGGNADPNTKAAIGGQLIAAAQLDPQQKTDLLQAFHTDLASTAQPDPNQPTA